MMMMAAVAGVEEEDHEDCNCMGDDCTEQEDDLLTNTTNDLIVRTVHNSGGVKKNGSTVNCTFRRESVGSSNCSSGQVTKGL